MTDIATTLRHARQFVSDAQSDEDPEAANGARQTLADIDAALSRLSAPPPEEIAGLIEEARSILPYWPTHAALLERMIAALSRFSALPDAIAGLIERTENYLAGMTAETRARDFLSELIAALCALVLENKRLKAEQHEWWCEGCQQRYCGAPDENCSRASCPKCGKWMTNFWEKRIRELEAIRDSQAWELQQVAQLDCTKRIRELEAERDALQGRVDELHGAMRLDPRFSADTMRAKTIEECKQAIVNARFGAPSNWGDDRPHGWHLNRPCTPEEASHHDNGCNDAFIAVSALAQSEKSEKEE